jgi:hypothetical protein
MEEKLCISSPAQEHFCRKIPERIEAKEKYDTEGRMDLDHQVYPENPIAIQDHKYLQYVDLVHKMEKNLEKNKEWGRQT